MQKYQISLHQRRMKENFLWRVRRILYWKSMAGPSRGVLSVSGVELRRRRRRRPHLLNPLRRLETILGGIDRSSLLKRKCIFVRNCSREDVVPIKNILRYNASSFLLVPLFPNCLHRLFLTSNLFAWFYSLLIILGLSSRLCSIDNRENPLPTLRCTTINQSQGHQ
jgi:hypothetical protein